MSTAITRQIVLDTETTGMNQIGAHYEGHRIIEIGAVEVINRRLTGNNFHVYLKPDRLVDPEAFMVHGISDEFLLNKPVFGDVVDDFLDYIRGAELVIHNASFDIGFMDYEFGMLNRGIPKTETFCKITDSLAMARKMFPGKRNSLDALCSRYEIDNTKRTLHGALLDSQILAEVYLAMTGGQTSIAFAMEGDGQQQQGDTGI
ncbi:DNA polymerase III subunit epsilon, partial [Cronobacter dublinensis]